MLGHINRLHKGGNTQKALRPSKPDECILYYV